MKRYFHSAVRPGSTAFHCDSEWNYLTLPDSSFLVCMFDEGCKPEPSWTELPHLVESTPIPAAVVTAVGALAALPLNPTTFHLAKALAAHNPRFHP